MKVTPVDLGLDLLKSDLVRSPGLHASTIFGDLFKELEPSRYDRNGPMNAVLMMLGSAFEDRFEKVLVWNGVAAERPEEFMSPEGIAYSPDLILFNGVTRLGEMKLTSMSLRDWPTEETYGLPPKADKYDCQMKLYAYWLNIFNGLLIVCSIAKPYAPELGVYELQWTRRELQENYDMCMSFARQRGLV